jgi:hypothetical protein
MQRATGNAEVGNAGGVPPIVHDVLRSPGQPLDVATRAFFEPRLGHDFSRVRVHTDAKAAESASAINALAYTMSVNIVFCSNQYRPETLAGRKLLAHKLVHVLQQPDRAHYPETVSQPTDPLERQAEALADRVALGQQLSPFAAPPTAATLHRQSGGGGGTAVNPMKTVTIDGIKLRGASHGRGDDVARANTVFAPCRVRFSLHRVDPTDTESDTWLGGDTTIAVSTSCTPTAEEVAAFNGAATTYHLAGRVRAFFVGGISPASLDAHSYQAGCGSATNEMVEVSNAAGGRELAHELGHILLNEANTAHSSDATNLMADPDPGTTLTTTQCATIYANA